MIKPTDIHGATLLTEAERIHLKHRRIYKPWWLQSQAPITKTLRMECVRSDGTINKKGRSVHSTLGVRPALRIDNLDTAGYRLWDTLSLLGLDWTVIWGGLVL